MKFKILSVFQSLALWLVIQFPLISLAQDTDKQVFSIAAGAGLSKLENDTLSLQPVLQPAFSIDYSNFISQKTAFIAGLQYFMLGGNANSPTIKFRNQYLGFSLGSRYYLLDFLFIEANLQYSQLLAQHYKVLDGKAANGVKRNENTRYNSQFEVIGGLGMELQRGTHFRVRYSIPIASMEYTQLQFAVGFDLSELKFPDRMYKFTNLNEALLNNKKCRKLVLHRTGITDLSPEISKLVNLQELYLDGNGLETLPDEIGDIEFLTKLSVRHNALIRLPSEIGKLENLEELYLEYNQLNALPDEIGQLSNLRFLYIGKNYLTELPASIGELTNLVELDVSNNSALLRIPQEIEKLKNLELLIVDRNTVFPIPFNKPNARLRVVVKD
jgi:hypothetical protein